MKKITMKKSHENIIRLHKNLKQSGFTLVELLVAMTISAMVFGVAWKFFDSSASTSREAAATSQLIDEARTALDEISKHLQMAAGEASPFSGFDPRVQPKSRNTTVGYVTGIYPYGNWQNRNVRVEGSTTTSASVNDILAQNQNAVFDGFIVLSPHSYPLSFEAQFIDESLSILQVPDSPRGLRRLANPNPFIVSELTSARNMLDVAYDPQWATRILRITDSDGFKQFSAISSSNGSSSQLVMNTPFVGRGSGRSYGIEVATGALDRNYEVAALDLYWYYVRQDPTNPANLQLVRDRLCASSFLPAWGTSFSSIDPQNYLAGGTCGERELTILANHVASFDVWFDCGTTGAIRTDSFPVKTVRPALPWNNVDNSCVSNGPSGNPERARLAHVLLALHSKNERKEMTDNTGFMQGGRLQFFDANLQYPGASPVTILQSDVFMRNYLYW